MFLGGCIQSTTQFSNIINAINLGSCLHWGFSSVLPLVVLHHWSNTTSNIYGYSLLIYSGHKIFVTNISPNHIRTGLSHNVCTWFTPLPLLTSLGLDPQCCQLSWFLLSLSSWCFLLKLQPQDLIMWYSLLSLTKEASSSFCACGEKPVNVNAVPLPAQKSGGEYEETNSVLNH